MQRPDPTVRRLLAFASVVAGSAALTAAACIVAPPPQLPMVPALPPSILHASVYPPEGAVATWPPENEFLIPISLNDPDETRVDVSVQVGGNADTTFFESQDAIDGGLLLEVTIDPQSPAFPFDPSCAGIVKVAVTDPNAQVSGADIVFWDFSASGCVYDAGAYQDGAFFDAPADALPVPPTGASP